MEFIVFLILELILGYLPQAFVYAVGIHGFAAKKIDFRRMALSCIISAVIGCAIRESGLFTFGVHTMLTLPVIIAAMYLLCSISLNAAIPGGIIMTLVVLASEIVDFGLLLVLYPGQDVQTLLNQSGAMFKTVTALPGTAVALVIAILFYRVRRKTALKKEAQNAA